MPASAHTLFDRVAAEYGQGPWQDELVSGREEYERLAGKIFEDDGALYEPRLAAFLEWYVAERPLSASGMPPAQALLERDQADLSVPDRAGLAAILASHRSVFQVTAVGPGAVGLDDLIDGARFTVQERESTAGFQAGDLVEARILWAGQGLGFARTFLFHPRDAREGVTALIAAAQAEGAPRAEIVGRLAKVYLRWHRQGQVGAARLYREAATPDRPTR